MSVNLVKEAAIYLAVMGVRNPARTDWENAIRVKAGQKGQKLNAQKLGAAVMEAQFDFADGISNEFLARELPPTPEIIEVPLKEKEDARKNKRTSRHKQVR